MNRITFWSIFLLWLITALHCKKYLVEVADGQGGVTQATTEAPQAMDWWRKDLEDEVDEEMIEIKSKYISFWFV